MLGSYERKHSVDSAEVMKEATLFIRASFTCFVSLILTRCRTNIEPNEHTASRALNMPAPVIYINGYPNVGKLTLGLAFQRLLTASRMLHNHDLIDPIEQKHPRSNPYCQIKRAKYRQARLKPTMDDPSLRDTIFLFTDSQSEHNECVGHYTDLALGTCAENSLDDLTL